MADPHSAWNELRSGGDRTPSPPTPNGWIAPQKLIIHPVERHQVPGLVESASAQRLPFAQHRNWSWMEPVLPLSVDESHPLQPPSPVRQKAVFTQDPVGPDFNNFKYDIGKPGARLTIQPLSTTGPELFGMVLRVAWVSWPYVLALAAIFASVLAVRHVVVYVKATTYAIVETTAEASFFYGLFATFKSLLPHLLPMLTSALRTAVAAYGPIPAGTQIAHIPLEPMIWWQDPWFGLMAAITFSSTAAFKCFGL